MARYEGLGVDIGAFLPKLQSAMEKRGYKIGHTMTGAASFLIEYLTPTKKPGVFGSKGTISVKGTRDNFAVIGIREDDEELWFIVEDTLIASAANPQAFRSHTEKEPVKMPATPTVRHRLPKSHANQLKRCQDRRVVQDVGLH